MSVSYPIDGGCFCGEVRYRINGAPESIGICHCQSCRRMIGAESVGWAVLSVASFAFVNKAPRTFRSSVNVERSFCEVCGTSLTYRLDGKPFVDVVLATLDDAELLSPTKETWCEERLQWNALNPDLAHFDQSSSRS